MKYNGLLCLMVSILAIYVQASDSDEPVGLQEAARSGRVEDVRQLVREGYSVNIRDHNRSTPLHKAVVKGHDEVVYALLEAGARVDAKSRTGRTPLHLALLNNQMEIACMLLNYHASVHVRCRRRGWTALHCAAVGACVGAVQMVLQAGVDVNAIDNAGQTSLHKVALRKHKGMIQALLDAGGEIDACDANGCTALELAVKDLHINIDVAWILARRGAGITPTVGQLLQTSALLRAVVLRAQDEYLEPVVAWKKVHLDPFLPRDLVWLTLRLALFISQWDRLHTLVDWKPYWDGRLCFLRSREEGQHMSSRPVPWAILR